MTAGPARERGVVTEDRTAMVSAEEARPMVRVESSARRGMTIVRPVGELHLGSYPKLRDALVGAAIDGGAALAIDLADLTIMGSELATVFSTVRSLVAEWPAIPIALVTREPSPRLARTSMPVCASVDEAFEALGSPDPPVRITAHLPHAPEASTTARAVTHAACRELGVPELSGPASMIANELVENVVRHTDRDGDIRLERSGDALTIVVTDHDPRPPVVLSRVHPSQPGLGLAIVAGVSDSWGHVVAGDRKAVWATLRAPGPDQP